jgi:protein O-GlcNAc transferase
MKLKNLRASALNENDSMYLNAINKYQQNRFEECIKLIDELIKKYPKDPRAWNIRSLIFAIKGNKDYAIFCANKAAQLDPKKIMYIYNHGNILMKFHDYLKAIDKYNEAIKFNNNYIEAILNKGVSLMRLQKINEALECFDKILSINKDNTDVYVNIGIIMQNNGKDKESIIYYDKAININDKLATAYFNKGNALRNLKNYNEAIRNFELAINNQENYPFAYGMWLNCKMRICDWNNYQENVAKLENKINEHIKVSQPMPILSLFNSAKLQKQSVVEWSKSKFPQINNFPKTIKINTRKIIIGYYSSDFRKHPVSYLMAELFEIHEKESFEIIAFYYGPKTDDEFHLRVKKSFAKFFDVNELHDEEVAKLSRELKIDIAVDLNGHTANSRTGIFAFRAAPIQVSYIGYLGTMGAEYYDYLIADKIIIPTEFQVYYCEKIVYLPSYQVNDSKQKIPLSSVSKQDFNLPSGVFVYCCFNASYKITPSTFDGWMRILKLVPNSVLFLYAGNQSVVENLKSEADKRGVNPSRLIFGEQLNREAYMARYRAADLFLDTLPYNAGATASDSLWAGLPVLTCMGESFASRVAGSLLHAIGLPELVTETQSDYEALAVELGTNPFKLKAIKDKLEKNRVTMPLFDTPRFTKNIEAAYTKMYERYYADLPPDHIYIHDLQ